MSEILKAFVQNRRLASQGEPGVYYVIKLPLRWELISHPWSSMGDMWHRQVWNSYLATYLTEAWGNKVDFEPYWRAFPRGRIERVGTLEFTIYHGDDLESFMGVTKSRIESSFSLHNTKVAWSSDPHETCDKNQKDQLRIILGIKENWNPL